MAEFSECRQKFRSPRTENRAKLDALGFIWDAVLYRFEEVVVPALVWFKAKHCGSMEVAKDCVLGEEQCREAGLPAHVGEMRLGQTVGHIRSSGIFVEGRSEMRVKLDENRVKLDELGFIWGTKKRSKFSSNR